MEGSRIVAEFGRTSLKFLVLTLCAISCRKSLCPCSNHNLKLFHGFLKRWNLKKQFSLRENYYKIPLDFKEISISALMFLPRRNPQKNMMAARKCPEFEGKVSGLRRAKQRFKKILGDSKQFSKCIKNKSFQA